MTTFKNILRLSVILTLFLVGYASDAAAQVVHVNGKVSKTMKNTAGQRVSVPLSQNVYIFDNAREAQVVAQQYRARSKEEQNTVNISANDVVKADYEGHFEADVSVDGALLVFYEGVVKYVAINGLQLTYNIEFTDEDGIILRNVEVTGDYTNVSIRELPPVDEGSDLHWNVTVALPEKYTRKQSRLIFQPAVIDCQTEDTVQYLTPLVYEGGQYHHTQQRRKSFDYDRNDPIAPYYYDNPVLNGDQLVLNWQYTYPKPDVDKNYKWVSRVCLSDYTHIYYDSKTNMGSCNARRPWRMLDAGFARKEMPLTEEFYEIPHSMTREVPRDLELKFIVGTNRLTQDSINTSNLNYLIRELRSYGRSLMNVTIMGTASPEGSDAFNVRLSESRAQTALNMIRPYVSSASVRSTTPHVYTWRDVADSLDRRGYREEANQVRGYATTNSEGAIRNMAIYPTVIEQILKNQRIMKCTYTVRQNKILEPEEALWLYYNDRSYREGGENIFSNGDYYHLFNQIKDPAELDKLTIRCYNELKDRSTSKYSPFAAYVANRMAVYCIDHDSTDISILAPFVDFNVGLNVVRPISVDNDYKYTVNRPAIVANQAIMYFKKGKLAEAAHLANLLPDTQDNYEIKAFTDLETLFFKQGKTPDEQQRAMKALEYVRNTNDVNNAVLCHELQSELGLSDEYVNRLVDALPDNSPKKWYIKGVRSVSEAEFSEEEVMELMNKLGVDEAMKIVEDSVPNFLAYLQHSFDLDQSYYKYYLTDANVSDEIREAHPYVKSRANAYRAKFNALMMRKNNDEAVENEDDNAEDSSRRSRRSRRNNN